MSHPDCAQLTALGPALALGALDPDEAGFARAHQRACRARHCEVREGFELAALIAASLRQPRGPSGALRERVLAAARAAPGGG